MKTTNYFIELIIAGISTVTWVLLLVLSSIDHSIISTYFYLDNNIPYATIAAIALPFVYVVGVVADRIWDSIFDLLPTTYKDKHLKSYPEYKTAKIKLLLSQDALIDKFEYNRTKIRICRAWMFNSILIIVSIYIFIQSHFPDTLEPGHIYNLTFIIIAIFMLFSSIFSFLAWKVLAKKEDTFLYYAVIGIDEKKTQPLEIERKFMVQKDRIPIDLKTSKYANIKQWYLSKFPVIRVRNIEGNYILGIKSKGDIKRIEHELKLTLEEYQNVKRLVNTQKLEKDRYKVSLENGLWAEIDVFKTSPHEDLITVEVEFDSMEQAEKFNPPDWFGEELSYDNAYKNSNMARDLDA